MHFSSKYPTKNKWMTIIEKTRRQKNGYSYVVVYAIKPVVAGKSIRGQCSSEFCSAQNNLFKTNKKNSHFAFIKCIPPQVKIL